jgi:integrase/recombinase XerD
MVEVRWERYPKVATFGPSRTWLQIQANLGLARNTIEAYGRALEDYLVFTYRSDADVITAAGNTFRHTSVI